MLRLQVSRGAVQKAVCVLLRGPFFGLVQQRLSPVTQVRFSVTRDTGAVRGPNWECGSIVNEQIQYDPVVTVVSRVFLGHHPQVRWSIYMIWTPNLFILGVCARRVCAIDETTYKCFAVASFLQGLGRTG